MPQKPFWVVLAMCGLLAAGAAAAETGRDLSPRARQQIQLLHDEKAARSPAERKLDSQLVYALRQQRHTLAALGVGGLEPKLRWHDGRLLVDLRANVTPALLAFLEGSGATVLHSYPQAQALRALVSLDLVAALAARPDVHRVRPADEAMTLADSVVTGGDVAHTADQVRNLFQVTGAGIKIGVLSDSVDFLGTSQTNGNLPQVTILPGQFGIGGGEGTAMLEIIHDLAPDAELYFATALNGVAGFAQNIRDLRAAGCNVIVDDVMYFVESPFQDGPIAQAVNEVCTQGALYFAAAGNSGNKNANTAGTWEGDFVDGGPATIGRGGRVHSFNGTNYNLLLPEGKLYRADLFWADPLGGATNDYDVYVLDATDTAVASSTNIQDGNDDPYEAVSFLAPDYRLVIVKYAGANRYLHLSSGRGRLAVTTSGAVRGHNASPALNAFSVAAVPAPSPAAVFTGGTVEFFSSDGPRRVFFRPDGTPITPNNFSSTGGSLRGKPDVSAADDVATSVETFPDFKGTSAAAPHAAAIATLLWSYNPKLSPGEVRSTLFNSALDIGQPGFDRDSGVGILMALPALLTAPPPKPRLFMGDVVFTVNQTAASLAANQCGQMYVPLRNLIASTGVAATGVTATLGSPTPEVYVDPAPASYPAIPPGAGQSNLVAFRISTGPNFDCLHGAEFHLVVTADNAGPFHFTFPMTAVPPGQGTTRTFTAAEVPRPVPDLGTLESGITVSQMALPLAKVTVALHVRHTFDSDLVLSLVGPDGTTVLLSANRGGSGANYGSDCATLTVFDDAAANPIGKGTYPFIGTFQPEESLAVFDGKAGPAVNGQWRLRLKDTAENDTGLLRCWSLQLTPIVCANGNGQCLFPPALTQQPQNLAVTNGGTARFSVTASGTGPLSYQWYFNGTNRLAASGPVLDLGPVTVAAAGRYLVVVSNPYGSAASAEATLTVNVPAYIVTAPPPLVVTNGNPARFRVVGGGTGPLSYQWYFYSLTNGTPASPSDNWTLAVLPDTQFATHTPGDYAKLVRYVTNLAAHGTKVVTLHVGDVVDVWTNAAQWSEATTNGLYALAAAGIPHLIACGNHDTDARDMTVFSRYFPREYYTGQSGWSGGFWTNGTAANNAFFTWTNGSFKYLFVALEIFPRTNVLLWANNVVAAHSDHITFILTHSYESPAGRPMKWEDEFGAGSYAQYGERTTGEQMWAGLVRRHPNICAVFSGHSWPAARHASLGDQGNSVVQILANWQSPTVPWSNTLVRVYRVFPSQNQVRCVTVDPVYGHSLTDPENEFSFPLVSAAAGSGSLLSQETGPELVLPIAGPAQAGLYTVVVGNAYGSARAQVPLTVVDPPQIVEEPEDLVATSGWGARFSVSASGSEPLSCQWYFNGTALAGETGRELTLETVSPASAGRYRVVVSSPYGSVTSTEATLTVLVPPFIATGPQDLLATNGNTARFGVVAGGTEPLSYQWYFNETNRLSAGTNAELVLGNIQAAQAGTYGVAVSNVCGGASAQARLSVMVAAQIAQEPENLVATNGGSAHFRVVAGGTEPLSYQWYLNGTALVGQTGPELNLASVSPESAGRYMVVVSNPYGSPNVAAATLTVLVPAFIATRPQDLLVTNGNTARFSVVAGGTEPLSYQWYFNGTNRFSEGTNAELVLGNVQPAQAGIYGVVVKNVCGSAWAQAILTVGVPPQITQEPDNLVVTNGGSARLSVSASGTEPLSYQWYLNGTALAGQTGPELNLASVSPESAGRYMVLVSNPFGSPTVAAATLTVLVPAFIATGPQDLLVTNGNTARFSVMAGGTEPLSYQWYFNLTNLVSAGTNAELVLGNVQPAQAGLYGVVVSNGCGSASAGARLTVGVPAQITQEPENLVATNGGSARFRVVAEGTEPLSYQWYFKGRALLGQTAPELALEPVSPASAGRYLVMVSNPYGLPIIAEVTLTVLEPAYIVTGPQDLLVTNGNTAGFSVAAGGTEPLGYQWYFNGTNPISEGTSAELVLGNVQAEQAGAYGVMVSNLFGSAWAQALLRVGVVPHITQQPENLVATNGGSARFRVSASGTEPLSYQWYFNGTALAGQAGPELNLGPVTPEAAGAYTVVVTSPYGCVTSAAATLTVLVPAYIVTGPQDLLVTNGNTARFNVAAGGTEPLGYQWYFNGTNLLSEGTNAELVLSNVQPAQAGIYGVAVSNVCGSASAQALLTVVAPPQIAQAPPSLVATNGDNVRFRVSASGTEPLSYQWWFKGTALAGETGPELNLGSVSAEAAGSYAVVVSSPYGVTSAEATLTVLVPAYIATQPQALVATNGGAALFSVVAGGTEPLSYQWYANGTRLEGQSGPELNLAPVIPESAGRYRVVVSNPYGSVASAEVSLTVLVPPFFVTEPRELVITNGQTIRFTAVAGGTEPLSYQWYFNGTNSLSEGTNAELALGNAQPNQAGLYAVVVSNVCGSATAQALLTVAVPPQITHQPLNQVATNGGSAQFTVLASGTEPLSYQWWRNGTSLPGANGPVLRLEPVSPETAGAYAVLISSPYGSVTSVEAFLTVLEPPYLVTEPQSLLLTNGNTAHFSVVAGGTEPLAYQWYFNGTNLLSQETNAELVLGNAQPEQAGIYGVVVSNLCGSAAAQALLAFLEPPQIAQGPVNQVATNDGAAGFRVSVSGTGPLSYQWYFNGTPLPGPSGPELALNSVAPEAAGAYWVVISSPYGSVTSGDATLTVLVRPYLLQAPESVVAVLSETARFGVAARGTEPLSYQWYFNGTSLPGQTNAELVLTGVQSAHEGAYSVVVSNLCGQAEAQAVLRVMVPPQIDNPPQSQVAVQGGAAQFRVSVFGTEPLTYQWFFNGAPLLGQTGPALNLEAVTTEMAGRYGVVVSNAYGTWTSSEVLLTVVLPPYLVAAPRSLVVTNGDLARFSVVAGGDGALSYQWYFNGTPLAGQTGPELNLGPVTSAAAGPYVVVVSSPYGSVTNGEAILTVLVPAYVVRSPPALLVTNGQTARLSVVAGGTEPLGYFWYYEWTNLLSAGTNAELVLGNAQPAQAGTYRVVVSNAWGRVSSQGSLQVVVPPLLAQGPRDLVVTNGGAARFGVAAGGTEPLSYQWYFNGSVLAGRTGPELELAPVTPESAGRYQVVVSSPYGSAGAEAALTVLVPAYIITQPQDCVANTGESARFSVAAGGTAPLSYRWYFNETNLLDEAGPELTIEKATPLAEGRYRVVVSNVCGVAVSAEATLTVVGSPFITKPPRSLLVNEGESARLAVVAGGTEPLSYFWYYNLTNLLGAETNAELVFPLVQLGQGGIYLVVVSNALGKAQAQANLRVVPRPPQILQAPQDQVANIGGAARFSLVADGSGTLIYEWFFNQTNRLAATGPELSLDPVTRQDAGVYLVVVSSPYGSASAQAALTVLSSPYWLEPFQGMVVAWGLDAVLRASVGGPGPFNFNWYFNKTNLLRAETNAVLVLTNIQPAQAGIYTVVARNPYGGLVADALVTVVPPPEIVQQPGNLTVAEGATVQFAATATAAEPVQYQWYFDGTNALAGATATALILTNVTMAQNGTYALAVTSGGATVWSQPATLRVLVPSRVVNFKRSAGTVTLSFTTVSGLRYTVEYSDAVPASQWTLLRGATKLNGTGETFTVSDDGLTGSPRFYRVRVE